MPLRRDDGPVVRRQYRVADVALVWNRRLHYYVGLYLLFFCWLFAFTGLLLNHPRWQFAEFWPNRVQSTVERRLRPLEGSGDLARARDLMAQAGIAGEIQWPARQPADGTLAFQVTRPGRTVDVTADPGAGRATLRQTDLNAWGVLHVLHTFTGMPASGGQHQRDWILTTVWAWAMDAVAAGLVFMVVSSIVMWARLKGKRVIGAVVLVLGLVSCGAFLAALRWAVFG